MQDEVKKYLLNEETKNNKSEQSPIEKYKDYMKIMLETEITSMKEKYELTIKKIMEVGLKKSRITAEEYNELNDYLEKILNSINFIDEENKDNFKIKDEGER